MSCSGELFAGAHSGKSTVHNSASGLVAICPLASHRVRFAPQNRPLNGAICKVLTISKKSISKRLAKRISKFGQRNTDTKSFTITAPLIAQLGKNFADRYLNAGEKGVSDPDYYVQLIRYLKPEDFNREW